MEREKTTRTLRNKVLLVTYHFPPSSASGTFRLLGFARHLPTFGWQPLVVAPPSLPWEPLDPELVEQIPDEAAVRYVPYPATVPKLARKFIPNSIWLPRAWAACKRVIAEHRPDIILTSGPPHCVHVVGHYLKRKTSLAWIADFRDPWISDGNDRRLGWMQRAERRWERTVFAHADLVLANAPNATSMFQATYPSAARRIVTLTNGFDPVSEEFLPAMGDRNVGTTTMKLLHAGEIYVGRNPLPLLEALAQVNAEKVGLDRPFHLEILGRNDGSVDTLVRQGTYEGFVSVQAQSTYRESLGQMRRADILVLFDSPGRRVGVPAKLYEYFRAGRPILALAEPNGDVATILRESGVQHRIAPLKDATQIRRSLYELAESMSTAPAVADPARLQRFTRENITQTLADLLDTLIRR